MNQFTYLSDPNAMLRVAHERREADAREIARYRQARDMARNARAARRAGEPTRDELVHGPSVPTQPVLQGWWRSVLRTLHVTPWAGPRSS